MKNVVLLSVLLVFAMGVSASAQVGYWPFEVRDVPGADQSPEAVSGVNPADLLPSDGVAGQGVDEPAITTPPAYVAASAAFCILIFWSTCWPVFITNPSKMTSANSVNTPTIPIVPRWSW